MLEGCSQSPKGLANLDAAPELAAGGSYPGEPESDYLSGTIHLPSLCSFSGSCSGLQAHLCKQELSFALAGGSWDGGDGA